MGGSEKSRLNVVAANKGALTWSWCTWLRPWCLRRRRAWRALRAREDEPKFGPPDLWSSNACCSGRVATLQKRCVRKCRWRTNSWCSWPCSIFRCPDAPAWAPCKCRCCSFPFGVPFSFWDSCLGLVLPSWRLSCYLSKRPFCIDWQLLTV